MRTYTICTHSLLDLVFPLCSRCNYMSSLYTYQSGSSANGCFLGCIDYTRDSTLFS
jgi:hypothetical protein